MPRAGLWRWLIGLALVIGGVVGVPHAPVGSVEPDASTRRVFHEANERYRNGRFAQAAEADQLLLQSGVESGALYYNLGNALLKSGRVSEALWAYLKARALLPRDADLRANVAYAQSLLSAGQAASIVPPTLVRWITLRQRCTTSELARGFEGLLWLAVISWMLVTWQRRVRPLARCVAWMASLGAGLAFLALVTQTVWIDRMPRAVTLRDRVDVKFSPQDTGTTHFTLPDGAVVRVLDQEFGWVQVKRADGRAGWVPADAVRRL